MEDQYAYLGLQPPYRREEHPVRRRKYVQSGGFSITLPNTFPESLLESTCASAALSATSTCTPNRTCRAEVCLTSRQDARSVDRPAP